MCETGLRETFYPCSSPTMTQHEIKERSEWVRKWIGRRYAKLLQELISEDTFSYKNFLRMSPEDYNYLLAKVTPIIKKQETHLRKAIS